jgi:hypothetical protein
VAALEAFARQEKIPVILFRKGQRKDDVAAERGFLLGSGARARERGFR